MEPTKTEPEPDPDPDLRPQFQIPVSMSSSAPMIINPASLPAAPRLTVLFRPCHKPSQVHLEKYGGGAALQVRHFVQHYGSFLLGVFNFCVFFAVGEEEAEVFHQMTIPDHTEI